MAAKLSVNVNKVATLRNARGGDNPSVLEACRVAVAAGSPGITVHPREDQRHITPEDVHAIAQWRLERAPEVELNIEGDARPDLLMMVKTIRPTQFTIVPVLPDELTSQARWVDQPAFAEMPTIVKAVQSLGVRVSLFVEPELDAVAWAADMGADRVELYTEPFAAAFSRGEGDVSFKGYVTAAERAHELGLGVNAGHDLDLDNLALFRTLPHLDEVSIGHALISGALWRGLEAEVRAYLDVLAG